jgi:hypothetical protein
MTLETPQAQFAALLAQFHQLLDEEGMLPEVAWTHALRRYAYGYRRRAHAAEPLVPYDHGVLRCSCGATIRQCRCPAYHTVRIVSAGCMACQQREQGEYLGVRA